MNAPVACPHQTGNPDAHSSPAAPSSTIPAVAARPPLTSQASSVDVAGLAGNRSAQEGGCRRMFAAWLASPAGSPGSSAHLMQGSPPPSTLSAGSHSTHSPPAHHYHQLLSLPVLHSSPRSRSMSRAYYLLAALRELGSRWDRGQVHSGKTRRAQGCLAWHSARGAEGASNWRRSPGLAAGAGCVRAHSATRAASATVPAAAEGCRRCRGNCFVRAAAVAVAAGGSSEMAGVRLSFGWAELDTLASRSAGASRILDMAREMGLRVRG